MPSTTADAWTDRRPMSAKFVVSGGFGAGKTTFVTAVSEIRPLQTERFMTTTSIGTDDAAAVATKNTTTVAMDFGKFTVDDDLVVYIFGTPGQERFGFMWDDLSDGALGAIVLVDTRRIEDSFTALDYFEQRGTPFIVAVNQFDRGTRHALAEVREALDLVPTTPIVRCDARSTESVKAVLTTVCQHVLSVIDQAPPTTPDVEAADPVACPDTPPWLGEVDVDVDVGVAPSEAMTTPGGN